MGRRRDDRGATAVLVAVFSTALLLLAALTIDFGQVYVAKRNLQKASDAGALAAAQVLTQYRGTCNQVLSNGTAMAKARAAAAKYGQLNRERNLDASTEVDTEIGAFVECDPALKVLRVNYGLSGDTPSPFGGETIMTRRRSQATVDVAPGSRATPMRPLAICSSLVDSPFAEKSGDFVKVHFPGAGHVPPDACPVGASGNWWLIDCPGERLGSASGLIDQIHNGCDPDDRVTVIPGQNDATTPGALTLMIDNACPDADVGDESCMSGHTGNITQGGNPAAWEAFMETGEEALFPVFCAPPRCSAVTAGGSGTNAIFPISSLMSAVVCGFHFDKNTMATSTHANCNGNPFSTAGDNSDNNYFIFKLVTLRTSGSNEVSECALGDEKCDGGLRRARLSG